MKKPLRNFILNIIAVKAASLAIPSINFENGWQTLLYTALALTAFNYLLKPIAKLLFLPINILTLGLLRWVINVIGLYLVAMFVKGFSILPYRFPGTDWNGLIIPQINCSLLITYVLVSFNISLVIAFLRWAFKK